jgi:hypothetical protein
LPDSDALLERSKALYRNKLELDDPNMSYEAISVLLIEFAEFGLDIDYSSALGITASDIFRSVTGVAYKSVATAAVLQDVLSVIDIERPQQAPSFILQMYSEALRARDWNERVIGDLISP